MMHRLQLVSLLALTACTSNDSNKADDSSDTGPTASTEAPWPSWVMEPWVWEDESTQESAMALVDGYIERDIPVGAVIIDSPWATGYSTYDWDLELYPDPQGMIDEFHAKGVRVFIWTVPGINIEETEIYNYAAERGYFMTGSADDTEPQVVDWWKGQGSLIDYFNPEAVEWWHTLVDKTLDLGIDGWKCDGLDFSAIIAKHSPYLGRDVERIEYSHAYYQDFHDYTRERLGDDRVNTVRPVDNYGADLGGPGVQFAPQDIVWAGWVGDQDPDFSGLEAALRNMYWSDHDGYTVFGSDIGGYRTDDSELGRSRDVFIRWAQLGALSAIMENGGAGEHRPWAFDEETTSIYRTYAKLHADLIPYLMEEGGLAFSESRGLMDFTDKATYAFKLGRDLFVVPVRDETNEVLVRLPAGEWVYAFDSSMTYSEEDEFTLSVAMNEYPLFFRNDSAVGATVLTSLGL